MEKIIFKKLTLLSYNHDVDIKGELRVDNQSLPYEYPKLYVKFNHHKESCIELSKKIKIKLYGVHGKTWFYELEPSSEFFYIVINRYYNEKEDVIWDISPIFRKEVEVDGKYGLIVHAHRLSELYDSLVSIQNQKPVIYFKSYNNFYLKVTLHSTNVIEILYLYIINDYDELKNLLSVLLEKEIEVLGYKYELAK